MVSIDIIPISILQTLVLAGVYPFRAKANGMGFNNESVLVYMVDEKGFYYGTTVINEDFKKEVLSSHN